MWDFWSVGHRRGFGEGGRRLVALQSSARVLGSQLVLWQMLRFHVSHKLDHGEAIVRARRSVEEKLIVGCVGRTWARGNL